MVRLDWRERKERVHLFEEFENQITSNCEIHFVVTALNVLNAHLFELNHCVIATHPIVSDLIPQTRFVFFESQRGFERENHVHRLKTEESDKERRLGISI